MAEVIVFPDIELWATRYIREALATRSESYTRDVFVSNTVPANRRERMVIVRDDGGPRLKDRVRKSTRVSVRVWAETEKAATDLVRLVAALYEVGADGRDVVRVRAVGGPYRANDGTGPQRLVTIEFTTRGEAA